MPETITGSERRVLTISGELRAKRTDSGVEVEGYAAKFNVLSHDLGGFREKIAPGAFARSIQEGADVPLLWMHDQAAVLARTKSKTLTLEEDSIGLKIRASLPKTSLGTDLAVMLERGDVDEMSFAFWPVRDDWDFRSVIPVRTLQDLDLLDVSAVLRGAYPQTEIGKRDLDSARKVVAEYSTIPGSRTRAEIYVRSLEAGV